MKEAENNSEDNWYQGTAYYRELYGMMRRNERSLRRNVPKLLRAKAAMKKKRKKRYVESF